METIFILFVLIVALIGLVGVRKENEAHEKTSIEDAILIRDFAKLVRDYREDNTKLINTNRAYKGANTKHKATIEKLEKEHEKDLECISTVSELVASLEERISKMREVIESTREHRLELSKQIDESKPMLEKLLTMVKKGNMEEAKAIVKSYYKM